VPGIFWGGVGFSFGTGFGIGFLGGFGWGWGHWGSELAGHRVTFNHNTYISHSRTIVNRGTSIVEFQPRDVTGQCIPWEQRWGQKFRIPWVFPYTRSVRTRSGAFSGFDHGGMREDFPPEGDQASEVAPTEASMAVADAIRHSMYACGICREFKNGEDIMLQWIFNFCST